MKKKLGRLRTENFGNPCALSLLPVFRSRFLFALLDLGIGNEAAATANVRFRITRCFVFVSIAVMVFQDQVLSSITKTLDQNGGDQRIYSVKSIMNVCSTYGSLFDRKND